MMEPFGVQEIKKKSYKKYIITTLVIALVIALLWLYFSCLFVRKTFGTKTIELGGSLSNNVEDYIAGSDWLIERATLDFTELDTSKTGEYTVRCVSWIYHYSYKIKVKDTVAPTIKLKDEDVYVAVDEKYTVEHFYKNVWDLSGDCEVYLDDDEVSFSNVGEEEIKVYAADASGNIAESTVKVLVDTAPVIVGARDVEVSLGSQYDPLKYVCAVDEVDGAVEEISVSPRNVNTNTPGKYNITYKAVDSFGLETTKEITVTVGENDSYSTFGLTKEELTKLVDYGYFKYEPLEYEDKEKAIDLVEPCMIDIYVFRDNGYGYGSGFVYEITNEYVYFLSVDHVTRQMVDNKTSLMFYDQSTISLGQVPTAIRLSEKNETSLFRISIGDIPVETLLKIKQIYVDTDVYSEHKDGDYLIAFAKNWGQWNNKKDLIRELKVETLIGELHYSDYYDYDEVIVTNNNITSGMSGCAVIDYKGRLLGLTSCSGTINGLSHAYSMRINSLDKFKSRLVELN